jgi:DNA-binding IclR family transcriptional regulator
MGAGTTLVLAKVKDGLTTVKEISESLGLPPREVRQYLRHLEKARKITFDKRSRPYRIGPLGKM